MRNFKFFHGLDNKMIVAWNRVEEEELGQYHGIDAEAELTNALANEIARTIDEDIINRLTREINGGSNLRLSTTNINADYFQHYLNMGDERA